MDEEQQETTGTDELRELVVDLDDLADALDGPNYEIRARVHLATGEIQHVDDPYDEEEDDTDEDDWLIVEGLGSRVAHEDMEEFIDDVADGRAQRELSRAIEGKGAFRRFRDALDDYPELVEPWLDFRKLNRRERARTFLAEEGIVSTHRTATEPRPEPPTPMEVFHRFATANPLGVLATFDAERGPEAALVALALTDDGALLFDTLASARKVANIGADPRVALVIGTGDVSYQVEGVAALPADDDERVAWAKAYGQQIADSSAGLPEYTVVQVRPEWIQRSAIDRDGEPQSEEILAR